MLLSDRDSEVEADRGSSGFDIAPLSSLTVGSKGLVSILPSSTVFEVKDSVPSNDECLAFKYKAHRPNFESLQGLRGCTA